jgi:hypothetical protein
LTNALAPGYQALSEDPDGPRGDAGLAYISAVRFAVLARPPKAKNLTKDDVRQRIRTVLSGKASELFSERCREFDAAERIADANAFSTWAPPDFDPEATPPTPFLSTLSPKASRAISYQMQRAYSNGNISKAARFTSASPLARPTDPAVVSKMDAMHPHAENPTADDMADEPGVSVFQLSSETTAEVVPFLAREKAAGLDGGCLEEITMMYNYGYANIVHIILANINRGLLPPAASEWLNVARLNALIVSTTKLRPLAVCAALLRAAGTCAMRQIRPDAAPYFTETSLTLPEMSPPIRRILDVLHAAATTAPDPRRLIDGPTSALLAAASSADAATATATAILAASAPFPAPASHSPLSSFAAAAATLAVSSLPDTAPTSDPPPYHPHTSHILAAIAAVASSAITATPLPPISWIYGIDLY